MKICIVGDGGWGTALAMILLENGHEVVVWGPFEDYLAEIRATGENARYLPGVKLPRGLTWTSDPAAAAVGAGLVVLATPSHFYRGVCARFAGLVAADADVVSVAKGFCEETRSRRSTSAPSRRTSSWSGRWVNRKRWPRWLTVFTGSSSNPPCMLRQSVGQARVHRPQ